MTQIPEVGSIWSRSGQEDKCHIVYADAITVLAEWISYGHRFTYTLEGFTGRFKPETRTVTHRRWVNLYADGYVGQWFVTEHEAKSCANGDIVETRLIEWTVEE